MSNIIGQFRNNSSDIFYTTNNGTLNRQTINDSYPNADRYIQGNFESGKIYCFSCRIVSSVNRSTTIKIKLKNGTNTDNQQFIQTITIPKTTSGAGVTIKYPFDIVFKPRNNYNRISFEIVRDTEDSTSLRNLIFYDNADHVISFSGGAVNYYQLNNIISYLINDNDVPKVINKIGIQGKTGLIFIINGEKFILGRNKYYELDNIIDINFISFVPKDNEYFILDYEYKGGEA